MSTNNKPKFLDFAGTQELVAKTKELINTKLNKVEPVIETSASISGTDKNCKINYNNDENCLEFIFSDN